MLCAVRLEREDLVGEAALRDGDGDGGRGGDSGGGSRGRAFYADCANCSLNLPQH